MRPRLGHVCVDLATIHATADADTDSRRTSVRCRGPTQRRGSGGWRASPLVGDDRPLHLEGTTLYLDRLWADESLVATDCSHGRSGAAPGVDARSAAAAAWTTCSATTIPTSAMAAATAVLRRLSVIAGGPGHREDDDGGPRPRPPGRAGDRGGRSGHPLVALAAPTGKAAARLEEAVRQGAGALAIDQERRDRLQALSGKTVHRLLGFNPGNRTRFRHHRLNRLPHDVVVVDETSMVSLSLMARLVEAVRTDARLILVGDPEQLASVEAGAVLGDIVGPAALGPAMPPAARQELADVTGQAVPRRRGRPARRCPRVREGDRRCCATCTATAVRSPRWPGPSGRTTPTT